MEPAPKTSRNARSKLVVCAALGLLMSISPVTLWAQKETTSKQKNENVTPLVGRVLAMSLLPYLGAGVGPQYEVFVFAVEADQGASITPIMVYYLFFQSDGMLSDSFFDYSKRYELEAIRDTRCDQSAKGLLYVENKDQSGKPLPPVSLLRFLDGAPKDVLKPDTVLACYTLRPGKYRVLNRDKSKESSTTQ